MTSVTLVDPGLDARAEIANYNKFMDEIFRRMNGAIKAKRLDPMDLRLESTADNEVGKKRSVRWVSQCLRALSKLGLEKLENVGW